jgi:hypothetical protein
MRLFIVSLLSAGVLVAAGCTSNDDRLAVSGKVTLKGAPLTFGDATITFTSVDGKGSTSGAPIKNGAYQIDREHGLKPGKYLIRITAGDGKTVANEEEAGAPGGSTNIVSVDRIPPEWNVQSTKEVEIKASGNNTFDFDIPNEYIPKSGKKQ